MEETEMESKNGATKSQMAIRCAKVAVLLSSLKSSPCCCLKSPSDDQDDELKEKQKLVREIDDLKKELAWKRIKSKQIRLDGSIDFLLQVMVVLSVLTFLFWMLFFMSR